MQSHIDSLEQIDNSIIQQQTSHVFYDPVACYMDDFNSQTFQPLISCES
jgi:hypothetical protein